jgi:hypothetical protein
MSLCVPPALIKVAVRQGGLHHPEGRLPGTGLSPASGAPSGSGPAGLVCWCWGRPHPGRLGPRGSVTSALGPPPEQDALGGNSRTVMIAHISPASTSFEESRTTLL